MGPGGLLGDVVDEEEDDLVLSLGGAPQRQVDVGPLNLDVRLETGLKLSNFKNFFSLNFRYLVLAEVSQSRISVNRKNLRA